MEACGIHERIGEVVGTKNNARVRDAEQSRNKILIAARGEFADRGMAGARVDVIAEKAEINKRMIYHYFRDKDGLYEAVLSQAYSELRNGEKQLDLSNMSPDQGMRLLAKFTFKHFREHPWFVKLLLNENLMKAKHLSQLDEVADLHPTLLVQIDEVLKRGQDEQVFRKGVDPLHLYLTIASLSFFYFSNAHTLGFVFSRDFSATENITAWEQHIVDVIERYLEP